MSPSHIILIVSRVLAPPLAAWLAAADEAGACVAGAAVAGAAVAGAAVAGACVAAGVLLQAPTTSAKTATRLSARSRMCDPSSKPPPNRAADRDPERTPGHCQRDSFGVFNTGFNFAAQLAQIRTTPERGPERAERRGC